MREIPEGYEYRLHTFISGFKQIVISGGKLGINFQRIDLFYGDWQILFSTKDAGEKEWKGVVSSRFVEEYLGYDNYDCHTTYKDYMALENGYEHDLSPTESGLSLLRSKALDTNKNYLIIKKD